MNIEQAAVGAFLGMMESHPAQGSVAQRMWLELAGQDRLRAEELHYGGARYMFPRAAWHFMVLWRREGAGNE